jgi:GNAT superfamily N-acetyltransferase
MSESSGYTIESEPNPQDVQNLINNLIEYNCRVTGYHDGELLAIFLRGATGELLGGLSGFTWGGTCKIEWLWVCAALRGQGTGREMMARAEEEALCRGCTKMVVETHSFQAPEFYQKLGFKVVGCYADYPRGYQEYFLEKTIHNTSAVLGDFGSLKR